MTRRASLVRLPVLLAACLALVLAGPGFPRAADAEEPQHRHDHESSHGPTSTHTFEDVDRWVSVFDDPARAAWQKPEAIPAELGLREGMVVADIGAGTGYFERFLAKAVGPEGIVYAVDTEPKMVDHLEHRAVEEGTPNVRPVLAAADDPHLPEAGVDVIFICDTWHHIGDRIDYLRRLATALRPGGRVAVVDFREGDIPVGPPPEHRLPAAAVRGEFAEAGWSLVEESDLLPWQYFLIFAPPGAAGIKPPEERR